MPHGATERGQRPVPPAGVPPGGRPEEIFDREAEWRALSGFVRDPRPGAALAVVRGRRRQGKTCLLEALARSTGGFYFGGQEAAEAESLHRLAAELARHSGTAPARWHNWEGAIEELLALGEHGPYAVVLDEFPELVRQSPSLPSVLHNACRRLAAEERPGQARLLLCGSTLAIMNRLFTGPSPLHGLAALDLVVSPFGFRQAARFWGLADPRLALLVHAVVGGTPAYRHDQVCDDVPRDLADFDAWVCRTVLNPRVPLFWEARHLLEQEPDHWDRALSHSALAAIASGCATRGSIAEFLDRPVTDVSRSLALLQDCGLLDSAPDAFRPSLRRYRITEPLLAFDHAVVRPHRSALEQEDAALVWRRVRSVFETAVVRPHFAELCRTWVREHAAPAAFGGRPASAAHGSLPDPVRGGVLESEVVVRGQAEGRAGALLSVGLARWDEVMDTGHLELLRQVLALLAARGEDIARARPACFSGAGFSPGLLAAAEQGEVVLVGLDRIYHGE